MRFSRLVFFIIFTTYTGFTQNASSPIPDYPPYLCGQTQAQKGAATFSSLWPYGIVVYEISNQFNDAQKEKILAGMKMIQDKTRINNVDCIRFKQRTNQDNYVYVYNGQGCNSAIGMVGSMQSLSLMIGDSSTGTCMTSDTAAHEFMHALGFAHEHTRPDRDLYVSYISSNLADPTMGFNFAKMNNYLNLSTPYDLKSIMHYQSNAFAKPGTYTLLSKTVPQVLPRNLLVTDIDAKEIQLLYKCSGVALKWNENATIGFSWAKSCDFLYDNLTVVVVTKPELCATKCRETLRCTHYTWILGKCYFKNNTAIKKSDAFYFNDANRICGILTPGEIKLNDTLLAGQSLYANFSLNSKNGLYKALLKPTGDFVVFREKRILFCTFTDNPVQPNLPFTVSLLSDGNLVVYSSIKQIMWSTKTSQKITQQPRLLMQDDGNLILYNNSNKTVLWMTNTTESLKKFKNKATNLCLDSNMNGTVSTFACNSSLFQNWIFLKGWEGFFIAVNKATGLYLSGNGSLINAKIGDGSLAQDWQLSGLKFLNRLTKRYLDTNSTKIVFGALASNSTSQNWII